ncbi:MAG TPA: hypothetical protein VF017_18640 [Thermoanaerobaculia bacterium]|nr:hypothetical protein [Thermoanaerobaculia bacterium]
MRKLGTLSYCLALTLLPLFLLACDPTEGLRKAINVEFPPVHPVDHQLAAILAGRENLALVEEPNFYLGVAAKDVKAWLPKAVTARLDPAGGHEVRASDIEVELGDQEVLVTANFDAIFDGEGSRAVGTATIHCALGIEGSALVLRPSATRLQLSRLRYKGTAGADALFPLINAALEPLLANLNGAIRAQAIPLTWAEDRTLDLRKELEGQLSAGEPGGSAAQASVVSFEAPPVHLRAALGRASVLVEPDGIHALGEIVSLTPELSENTLAELRGLVASAERARFTSNQLAVLASCPAHSDDAGLPPSTDGADAEFRSVCQALLPLTLLPRPTPSVSGAHARPEALAASLSDFRSSFSRAVTRVDPSAQLPAKSTRLVVSRAGLETLLNDALRQVAVSAELVLPTYGGSFNEVIRTEPAPDLKCTENAGPCESDFHFRPYSPRGCDSDCAWYDLGCHGRKLDCERLKEQERLAYEVEKAAALAAWSLRKAACELIREAKMRGCEINQGWLEAVGNMEVGRIKGDWNVGSPQFAFRVGEVQLEDGLSALSAHLIGNGKTRAKATFRVTPFGVATLACYKEFDGAVEADVLLDNLDLRLAAGLQSVSRKGNELQFEFLTTGQKVSVALDPPPVRALLEQNAGTFLTSCPVAAGTVAAIAAVGGTDPVGVRTIIDLGQSLERSTFEFDVQEQRYPVTVKPFRLHLGTAPDGRELVLELVPEWNETSLGFGVR